ncbi:glycosyltransferase family 39 protein [Curtobacterium sp. DN_7.5]|uniref:glycosyltransferase family 39 protein n=1 Tax=Curtobacterium sp. DN_7.5 TaxID=3049047 RepID=UPI001F5891BB|nr:glycosyltransferase family 39 protein [Curtobacterium sp. DN_7.5]
MTARREWTILAGVTAAWIGFLLLFAFVTPAFGAPDEPAYVDAAFRTALGLGWPPPGSMHYLDAVRQVVEHPVPAADRVTVSALLAQSPGDSAAIDQMSQHPPTYFLVAAAVLRAIGWGSHSWGTAVLALRLLDVVVVAALPVLVWATVRRATRSPRTALVAPFLLFAVPQLAQVTSGVTVWAPMVLFGAVTVWLAVRVLTGDRSRWTTAGLAVSVTAMSALTALGLVAIPFAVVVVLLGRSRSLRARLVHAAVVFLVPVVATGWWWVRTLVRSGTLVPDALRAATTVVPYPEGGPNPGAFAGRQWDGLTNSFFGLLGADQWVLPPALVDSMTVLALTVLAWSYARRGTGRGLTTTLLVWPALVLVATLAYSWRNYLGTHQGNGLQGRFLFVAVVALIAAQAIAWRALVVRPALRQRLARVAVVAALVIGAYGFGVLYRGGWEDVQFRVTVGGLDRMGGASLGGTAPVALAAILFLAAGVWSVVAVWRLSAARTAGPVDSSPRTPSAPIETVDDRPQRSTPDTQE